MLNIIISFMSMSVFAATLPDVECTGKWLNQKTGGYQETKLAGGWSKSGIYSANVTIDACRFQAQALYPDKFQLYISHDSGLGISDYGGFDPQGHSIVSFSQDKGNLVCMLVCSRK